MTEFDAKALQQAFADLPLLDKRRGDRAWYMRRRKLRYAMQRNNPARFLNWAMVRGAMFVGHEPFIQKMFSELMDDGARDWHSAIQEPGIGQPARLPYAEWTSGNMVLQAYHLKQYMDVTGLDVRWMTHILEVGGGYGALALICRRLGFTGVYHIFDFPEFILLQRHYVRAYGYDSRPVQDWRDVPALDLLIALASWAEMPLDEREPIERQPTASYLVTVRGYGNIDNNAYFKQLAEDRPDYDWYHRNSPHSGNVRYLIGARGIDATD